MRPVSPLQGAEMQVYDSFSGCRNHSALHGGMGYSLICPLSIQTLGSAEGKNSEKNECDLESVGSGGSLLVCWLVSPNVDGKWCFKKTLVLAFQCGRIQAERVGVNEVY
jgi:hypothetical protein